MRAVGILLCAGSASRMGFDKLSRPIAGRTAIERSADALIAGGVTRLILTAGEKTRETLLHMTFSVPYTVIAGGETRTESVLNALKALKSCPETADDDAVLIHDAARCMVTPETVSRCIESIRVYGSGIAAMQATDTVLQKQPDGRVAVVPRDEVLLMQTPQGFRFLPIYTAYTRNVGTATDDCTLFSRAGYTPHFVLTDMDNFKLTTPADFSRAERMLTRYGTGFDTHRLVEERKLILGGIEIPYEKGLLGHSDADVLLHAIMDALLGAAALGDIGKHFPDNDPAYKGADSRVLLLRCVALLREKGFAPASVDATVIAQRPKLAPYIPAMRHSIASALGVSDDMVSVKATTTEGMNDEGRGLCISAQAIASLR